MNGKLIIVAGYLAAGKSTFTRRLSADLNIPYLIKDTFKSALCANVDLTDGASKSLFSSVTFDAMMYVTERFLEASRSAVIEGNFVPRGVKKTDEAGTIRALVEKHGGRSLTFKFVGDTRVLYKRFTEREALPERGQANMIDYVPSYDEFNQWCHCFDAFDVGGEVIKIDTTDFGATDFDGCIAKARKFLRLA